MKGKIAEAINEQINAELWSAYLYLSMGANFRVQGLDGIANWFEVQFREEIDHALILYNFMNSCNARVVLMPIEGVETEWNTPLSAFEAALEHEKKVTRMIHNINKLAIEEDDYATRNRMVWFVDEQVEEEEEVRKVIDDLELVKGKPLGLYMIDEKLAKREYHRASAL